MIDLDAFKGFTPGPWSRQSEHDVWCGDVECPNAPLFQPNLEYRRWGRDISRTEREANALLAAAAPDLLALAREQREELKMLRALIDDLRRGEEG